MLLIFYKLFIFFYRLGIAIASLRNKKAKTWIAERVHWESRLTKKITASDKTIWMHCSSAGEFEQGKPIIESLKRQFSDYKIVVSFFSPSGFSVAKNYAEADVTCYLPLDTAANAKKFVQITHPQLVIFVKYDFWYYHLKEVAKQKIPLLLVSAAFRKEQAFFKWYGGFYRKMLGFFNWIFVQNTVSLSLLNNNGIIHCSISGDTRFDRVQEIANCFTEIPRIKSFIGDKECIVAGSTWGDDEKFLSTLQTEDLKIIIAPHEINAEHVHQIQVLFPKAVLYSELSKAKKETNVLIIDNVGMLSRLYNYATITYIGGGFTKDGVHNVLEAAVYGKPVIFGNNYQKYLEAIQLVEYGGALTFSNEEDLKSILTKLLSNDVLLENTGNAAKQYVAQNTGATGKIISYIQEKRLLTN
ncbi:MAG: 3-deoxy-D-manno-octulosonic acid transferase [Chitinophagaceae bacterium]